MCGICGMFGPNGFVSQKTLERMNAQIVRRGPDGAGIFVNDDVALAMRRLAIIDLEGGKQPIFNERGDVCVVFNGEIYNYREVKQQLVQKGHVFRTDSDTEVLVHLYEEHGAQLTRHLEGMFAFALWDNSKRSLVVARDRLGIKPLYYSRSHRGLVFASEIKSILSANLVSPAIDWQALDEFLTYTNIPGERTIYADIRQVLPGTTMTFYIDGTSEADRYWTIPSGADEQFSESQWVDRCEAELRRAVESHLVSDVPVGAFLSGGVDSGLIVALMADMLDRPVDAFTIGFEDAGSSFIDERKYAKALADRYRVNHHQIEVKANFEEVIWDIVDAFDQPFADDSVVPSYYVSQATAKHVKVAMTGLGGDELFGGYRRHLGLLWGERYQRVPRWLRERLVLPAIEWLPESKSSSDRVDHLKRFARGGSLPASQRYQLSMSSLSAAERRNLFVPEAANRIAAATTEQVISTPFDHHANSDLLERALRTDLQTYLVDDILTLTDRLSMWHSLELRVPYLDHRFVEFAMRVPSSLKIRRTTQKYLLKQVAERWLPTEMIYHKKQGFEAPMGRWLRGPLLPFLDATLSRAAVESTGIFRYEEVRRLRDEHVSLKRKNSKVLFSLMMFQLWHNRTFGVGNSSPS